MPSEFDQYVIDAAVEQFALFGEEILFGQNVDEAETITAIVGSCDDTISDDDLGETRLKFRQIIIPIASKPETPRGYVAIISGLAWLVEETIKEDAAMATLQCKWAKVQSRHHETLKHKIKG